MTGATLRMDGVTANLRRHSCPCSSVRAGGRQRLLPSALPHSKRGFILLLVDSTWKARWASIILRKRLVSALPSAGLMPSLMATAPTFCLVSSARTIWLRPGKQVYVEALEYAAV